MDEKIPFIQKTLNAIFFRNYRARRHCDELLKCLDGVLTDKFLIVLLNSMRLVLFVNPSYRKNIIGFNAKYVFTDKEGLIYVVAEFEKNRLTIRQRPVSDPVFTLKFKDTSSLMKLLMSDSPDVLNALLHQEVDFTGNVNYLYKFAYMAMHLKMMVLGKNAA